MARIVIALGGNALGNTPAEQRERVAAACPALVGLIHQGHEIITRHGGTFEIGNADGGGALVTITLPIPPHTEHR